MGYFMLFMFAFNTILSGFVVYEYYLDNQTTPKYKKTSFSNPGHARNLCRKLNVQFKTDKFTVVFMNSGSVVYPDDHQVD